jgi:soluble lytic murein transglycosylase-like protein
MTDDMYVVLQRIDDIKKRFGLTRHNTTKDKSSESTSFSENLSRNMKDGISGTVDVQENLSPRERINRIADFYADKNRVPSSLVKAVIEAESGYDSTAVSPKGAMGLMQLMPSTVDDMGVENPFSPEENISAGTSLLKSLVDRYKGDYKKALAAYNAGPEAVDRSGGVPNYRETKEYVDKVIKSYLRNK